MIIAGCAGDWRAAGEILLDEWLHHSFLEPLLVIHHVMRHSQMLGHTLGAAGVVETIACVLAMRENFLPGTPRLNAAAEGVPAGVVREPRAGRRLKNVLKLNVGFGGMNGALILSHG